MHRVYCRWQKAEVNHSRPDVPEKNQTAEIPVPGDENAVLHGGRLEQV